MSTITPYQVSQAVIKGLEEIRNDLLVEEAFID
jgi:hypothetical protein